MTDLPAMCQKAPPGDVVICVDHQRCIVDDVLYERPDVTGVHQAGVGGQCAWQIRVPDDEHTVLGDLCVELRELAIAGRESNRELPIPS